MRLEIHPRFHGILHDGLVVPEIGKVPVRGVLNVDESKISPEVYRFIMLEPHLLVDGLTDRARLGLAEVAGWEPTGGNPTHTMLPASAYSTVATVIPGATPIPGRVLN